MLIYILGSKYVYEVYHVYLLLCQSAFALHPVPQWNLIMHWWNNGMHVCTNELLTCSFTYLLTYLLTYVKSITAENAIFIILYYLSPHTVVTWWGEEEILK